MPFTKTLQEMLLMQMFCMKRESQWSLRDLTLIISSRPVVGGRRSHRGPVFLIHEVMGCGAITPATDAPLLIANSHLPSPYKSLQLPSDQEDLAQAAGMGEGGTDLGQ